MFWITEITTVAAELLFLSVLIVVIRKIILSRLGWGAFVSQGKVELGYSGGASEADVCTKNLEKGILRHFFPAHSYLSLISLPPTLLFFILYPPVLFLSTSP